MTDVLSPNQDQADFWSSDSGAKWVHEERLLDATLGPVLDWLLEEASLQPEEAVLDIGCGTGASTLAAARIVGHRGHVSGADISHIMLKRARERAEEASVTNVDFVDADAQIFPFVPDAFDVVISRFGVMFFADPVAAFVNIARGLKPGGRVVFLAWGALGQNPWFSVPRAAAIERVGAPPPMDPREPGPLAFAERDYVTGILKDAGLSDVRAEEVSLDLTPPGDLRAVAEFATYLGPAARILRLMEASETDAAAVAKSVEVGLRAFEKPSGMRVPAVLNLFSARRPYLVQPRG